MASTNSGITTDAATGERYIPSSVRADGSKRREIRVRPGYRPPEDVELYKNRAAQAWKNRGNTGVPGAESLKNENESPAKTGTAASNKNAKRREAKKKAKAVQIEIPPAMWPRTVSPDKSGCVVPQRRKSTRKKFRGKSPFRLSTSIPIGRLSIIERPPEEPRY